MFVLQMRAIMFARESDAGCQAVSVRLFANFKKKICNLHKTDAEVICSLKSRPG
jgi:hypothetical protein